ncbi:MAG: hypothetical protein WBQ25_01515 [Nitrososphaeraceae archaeon]
MRLYADGTQICELNDTSHPAFVKRQGNCTMPIDQIRIDNWPEPEGNGSKYTHTTTSGPFNG